jgi:hypothetical protein
VEAAGRSRIEDKGSRIESSNPPVEALAELCEAELGWTMTSGRPPVGAAAEL